MIVEDQSHIIAFLAQADVLDEAAGGTPVRRITTHISELFIGGDRVLKLKRAVRFPYLDFSTAALRRAACEAEVAVNRRTAPDLSRGVVAVTREADGRLALGGKGEAVDWLVDMRRFDDSLLFDRLAKSRDKKGLMKLATRGQEVVRPRDVFKDPLVIEFLGLPESPKLVESKLEQALLDNLQHFLMELGTGFAFVSRQERITLDGDHFYIDLVFYHTILKCYVLIDLKVGKLTHADLGQIQFYVNYYDRERCTEGDNPTLGLILCPDKNDAVVKYTLGEQQERNIFASRYQLYLPTVEELESEIRRELRQLTPTQAKPAAKKRGHKA